jgi:selenocysteine lyase/cysteine desulfurase
MLHHDHMIEVPIKCLEGRLYARLSSHVYNDFEDYLHLSKVIKKLI